MLFLVLSPKGNVLCILPYPSYAVALKLSLLREMLGGLLISLIASICSGLFFMNSRLCFLSPNTDRVRSH